MMKETQTYGIYHDLVIQAEASEIFSAISNPKHLVNWWPQKCTGLAKPGAEYNFCFGEEYDWYGVVSQIVDNELFYIRMTKSDPDWDPTTFGFKLIAATSKTSVQFSHTGWVERNAHLRISSYCWALLLHGLKKYVEAGEITPFEQRS